MTNTDQSTTRVVIEAESLDTRRPMFIILSESAQASVLKDVIGLTLAACFAALDAAYLQTGTLAAFCGMLAAILIGGKISRAICRRMDWEDSRMYLTKPQFVALCRGVTEAGEEL